ncbi:hypothetical protein JOF41_005903 [Saccharothrix coeruleofusca]|uniref:hypothetical protein n=1 Tax=Saccharothrix coeruleofusca TaxID=33919 RepID=UPI001AE1139E|nr:hypothetical protein [Saccharothrix coeruleofusca]MBP2339725.1 hypothetical protein [Saccharothrix coeruleofusca]
MDVVHGGMWAVLGDESRIKIKPEPDGNGAEVTFFGSFEISLSMSESTLTRFRDLCAKALRDAPVFEEDAEPSWTHPAAPSA